MNPNEQPAEAEQLQPFATRYLNVGQVADLLGVPKSFIYRRTARGHDDPIPHYRIGGHLRFKLDDVEEWVEKHCNEPARRSPASLVSPMRENTPRRASKPLKQTRGGRGTP